MNTKDVLQNLKEGKLQRILGFGSSNTERFLSGMHWFDCLDLAICQTMGRNHRSINTGIGGHTTDDLLARFEQDAEFYKPHMVVITIGGNDSNPDKNIPLSKFEENLKELKRRFDDMDCAVLFQTYYSFDALQCEDWAKAFHAYMEAVRKVANDTGADLMDHLAHWEPFRQKHYAQYLDLMQDACHVNYLGNMVMGLDLARKFDLDLGTDRPDFWRTARAFHALLDRAAGQ